MKELTKRQLHILDIIRKGAQVGNLDIKANVEKHFDEASRVTVIRDINVLLSFGLINKIGKGRSVYYEEASATPLLRYIDVDRYFKKGPDERNIAFERFNNDVFKEFRDIFSAAEIKELEEINGRYVDRVKKITPVMMRKEFERLTIELSWKSSQIEGNTYSLIDTEILIKENKEAKGHKKEEAIMILNHKKVLDYIIANRDDFKKINNKKIEHIHAILVQGLDVAMGIRKKAVGIVGTRYRPLDNVYQIQEALEAMAKLINNVKDPFTKAFIALVMTAYIQPFEDGNKRTSRLLSDAILLAYGICPLSYRSINEADYKKAVVLFYEQNNVTLFKELFVKQFKFAVENYF